MEEIISAVSDIFEKNKVRHVIIGGIAVLAWGKPRITQAVDVVTTLSPDVQEQVIKDLSTSGFITPKDARE